MALLTRDAILATPERKTVAVPVPEWGGEVHVRMLSGEERDAWEQDMAARRKEQPDGSFRINNVRAALTAATACDEDGKLLFGPDDVEALGRKFGAALERIHAAAGRLNRIGSTDEEELAKN